MVSLRGDDIIMPEETKVAVVELHFLDEAFAHEECFLLVEVHVVVVAQRTIHNHQRMEGQRREFVGLGVDPANGTRGLETETDMIREAHCEIIAVAGVHKSLHLVDGAP